MNDGGNGNETEQRGMTEYQSVATPDKLIQIDIRRIGRFCVSSAGGLQISAG